LELKQSICDAERWYKAECDLSLLCWRLSFQQYPDYRLQKRIPSAERTPLTNRVDHIRIHTFTHTNNLSTLRPRNKNRSSRPSSSHSRVLGGCRTVRGSSPHSTAAMSPPLRANTTPAGLRSALLAAITFSHYFSLPRRGHRPDYFVVWPPPVPRPLRRGKPARPSRPGASPTEFRFLLSQEQRSDRKFAFSFFFGVTTHALVSDCSPCAHRRCPNSAVTCPPSPARRPNSGRRGGAEYTYISVSLYI